LFPASSWNRSPGVAKAQFIDERLVGIILEQCAAAQLDVTIGIVSDLK